MDINRAKEIIVTLAEGIDPTTGEVLPPNSVCNKGEVVRALYTILNVYEDEKQVHKENKKEPDAVLFLFGKKKRKAEGKSTQIKLQ